jgi:hypothetical protein
MNLIDLRIDALTRTCDDGHMTYAETTLVPGGTGKDRGTRPEKLTRIGIPLRTPARSDAGAGFDWGEVTMYRGLLRAATLDLRLGSSERECLMRTPAVACEHGGKG